MFLINDISTNNGFARKRFCLKSIWYIRHIPSGSITTNELPRKCLLFFTLYLKASPLPPAPLAVAGFMVAGLAAWQYSDRLAGLLDFAVCFLFC